MNNYQTELYSSDLKAAALEGFNNQENPELDKIWDRLSAERQVAHNARRNNNRAEYRFCVGRIRKLEAEYEAAKAGA